MKHKITHRLVAYFSVVLLLFSVVVGGLFWILSARLIARLHEENLKERAISIAGGLSASVSEGHHGHGVEISSSYLELVDDIAMCEVWLVDERARTIQTSHHMDEAVTYAELPDGAEELIRQVFSGDTEVSGAFSKVLGASYVTVGAPVPDGRGKVAAALLLHSPVEGLDRAKAEGALMLLLSILVALLLGAGLSILLARRFIGPLQKMKEATGRLRKGDYAVRTGVRQDDEIGALAANIDELSVRLGEMEQERKNLDKLRMDFISNISHELRTPVTVIKGSLEVLVEGLITDPAQVGEYYRQMTADAAHLERLVNDLLELSRLQSPDFKMEMEEWDLAETLEEAVRSMRRIATQRGVEIKLEKEDGGHTFTGDYGRLRQMFTIVLDNAVKFSPQNVPVEVKMQKTPAGCTVLIRDHGRGIPPEDIPHIFDRFHRERSEQNKSGTGLGLAIAKQIGNRHGVEIICESREGEGACFSFLFPRSGERAEAGPDTQ